MLEFWKEREKDIKTHHARRAQDLAKKYFRGMCPVKFAELAFPEVKLSTPIRQAMCRFYAAPDAGFRVMFSGQRAGKSTLNKFMRMANDHAMTLSGVSV